MSQLAMPADELSARTLVRGGVSIGGVFVIVGIVLMITASFWIGLIGLILFGGFARGRWY